MTDIAKRMRTFAVIIILSFSVAFGLYTAFLLKAVVAYD
jgi:hypothetical protein